MTRIVPIEIWVDEDEDNDVEVSVFLEEDGTYQIDCYSVGLEMTFHEEEFVTYADMVKWMEEHDFTLSA